MNASELLGYRHFFREGEPESQKLYAVKVGKDNIQRLCCLMLILENPRFLAPCTNRDNLFLPIEIDPLLPP